MQDRGISQEEIDIVLDVTIPMEESFKRWEELSEKLDKQEKTAKEARGV